MILIIIGLVVAVILLECAGGVINEGESGAGFVGLTIMGIAFIVVCCSSLYHWRDGAASTSWFGLDKKATYLLISQTGIDAESKTYIVVLQNAIDKSFWCIVQNGSQAEAGILKIAKDKDDQLTLKPVIPFSTDKPAPLPKKIPEKPAVETDEKKPETPKVGLNNPNLNPEALKGFSW
jgi:hypothetical protein